MAVFAAALMLAAGLLAVTPALRVAPARAASSINLAGRGWGHGRGMGQYGALGYAINAGWSGAQILDHFYGGTGLGSQSPGLEMSVRMVAQDGAATTVVQERGHLYTSADDVLPGGRVARAGIRIERTAPGTFRVYDGSSCAGNWTPRAALVRASSLVIYPATYGDDRTEMLQMCESTGSRWLRGYINAVDNAGVQRTVNALATDEYLRGVVPRESPASWGDLGTGKGMEALKAQAVAARSYSTAENRYPYAKTCDTTACQVYKGRAEMVNGELRDLEDRRTDAAIAQTAGHIRQRSGAVALTEFSSSTGGYTAGGAFPAVTDDGDAVSLNPNHTWTTTIAASALESRYQRGTFENATVLARNGLGQDGGRVTSLRLFFSGGSLDVTGNDFQAAFGLKSNWFTITLPGATLAAWESLGGGLRSGVGASSWGAGRLDAFAQGTDNAMHHRWYDGSWKGWESLGGVLKSTPAATSRGLNTLDVFVQGSDDRLYQRRYAGGWSAWLPLSGILTSAPAAAASGGRLMVFVRGTDNGLHYRTFDTAWSPWIALGGQLTSAPAATAWPDGRFDVFARGTDNALYTRSLIGGAWGSWQRLGGSLTAEPGAAAWGTGRLDVFVRGTDDAMWHLWFANGAWSGWESRGGVLRSGPGVASWAPKRLDAFVRGTDDAMHHTWGSG